MPIKEKSVKKKIGGNTGLPGGIWIIKSANATTRRANNVTANMPQPRLMARLRLSVLKTQRVQEIKLAKKAARPIQPSYFGIQSIRSINWVVKISTIQVITKAKGMDSSTALIYLPIVFMSRVLFQVRAWFIVPGPGPPGPFLRMTALLPRQCRPRLRLSCSTGTRTRLWGVWCSGGRACGQGPQPGRRGA